MFWDNNRLHLHLFLRASARVDEFATVVFGDTLSFRTRFLSHASALEQMDLLQLVAF